MSKPRHDDGVPVVLSLCTHNAGRTQMALGYSQHLAGDHSVTWSDGSDPPSQINPAALTAMAERDIDICGRPRAATEPRTPRLRPCIVRAVVLVLARLTGAGW